MIALALLACDQDWPRAAVVRTSAPDTGGEETTTDTSGDSSSGGDTAAPPGDTSDPIDTSPEDTSPPPDTGAPPDTGTGSDTGTPTDTGAELDTGGGGLDTGGGDPCAAAWGSISLPPTSPYYASGMEATVNMGDLDGSASVCEVSSDAWWADAWLSTPDDCASALSLPVDVDDDASLCVEIDDPGGWSTASIAVSTSAGDLEFVVVWNE